MLGRLWWLPVIGLFCLILIRMGEGVSTHEPAAFLPQVFKSRLEIKKSDFAKGLKKVNLLSGFPKTIEVSPEGTARTVEVEYSLDERLQSSMETLLKRYRPDYGAFVAIDATTGRILSLVSTMRGKPHAEPLYLRASFPSASVFKVVTAAAAISKHNYSPDHLFAVNGGKHTLIKRNVLKNLTTKWTRYISFRQAFAESVNSVFGKIGVFDLNATELRDFADRFGFNRELPIDLPMQNSVSQIPDSGDQWEMAEVASGYTQANRMSPIHGAMIAAAIANDGVLMEPYFIERANDLGTNEEVFRATQKRMNLVMDPITASQMKRLMRETVISGTSRSSFQGFFSGASNFLDVGGKTGTLSGFDPPGKYDWFVGYGESGSQKIAVAALTINGRISRVKSSSLARRAFETYFQGQVAGIEKPFENVP